jgi:quercetin dioxygenase-like cupin family protein
MQFLELSGLRELELADGVTARAVHTGNVSVAHVRLSAGAVVPEHTHYHEQVVNVVDGEMELTVNGTPMVLSQGRVMILPPLAPHSARAITDCYVIDIFHPVRDDFRAMAQGSSPGRPYGKK